MTEAVQAVEAVIATGNPEVDAALELVRGLADLPVGEQVAVYEDVQRRLAGAISRSGGG